MKVSRPDKPGEIAAGECIEIDVVACEYAPTLGMAISNFVDHADPGPCEVVFVARLRGGGGVRTRFAKRIAEPQRGALLAIVAEHRL